MATGAASAVNKCQHILGKGRRGFCPPWNLNFLKTSTSFLLFSILCPPNVFACQHVSHTNQLCSIILTVSQSLPAKWIRIKIIDWWLPVASANIHTHAIITTRILYQSIMFAVHFLGHEMLTLVAGKKRTRTIILIHFPAQKWKHLRYKSHFYHVSDCSNITAIENTPNRKL